MTDFLPLFPLKMVVFPDEKVNLHIFEPRYRQLIREVEQNKTTFGIPSYIDDQVMEFGTEISLVDVKKRYPNGSLDISTEAMGVFKIKEFYTEAPNKLYAGADIDRLKDDSKGDFMVYEEIQKKLLILYDILHINKEIPDNNEQFNCFKVAHTAGFTIEQEYKFLCIQTEQERQQFLLQHLDKLIPIVKEMERLKLRSQMNGHFKNVIPPDIA